MRVLRTQVASSTVNAAERPCVVQLLLVPVVLVDEADERLEVEHHVRIGVAAAPGSPLVGLVYQDYRYEQQLDYTRPLQPALTVEEATWSGELLASR